MRAGAVSPLSPLTSTFGQPTRAEVGDTYVSPRVGARDTGLSASDPLRPFRVTQHIPGGRGGGGAPPPPPPPPPPPHLHIPAGGGRGIARKDRQALPSLTTTTAL